VTRLWGGDILCRTDALQLVLILDFICDWARDMYRNAIKTSLEVLASNTCQTGTISSSDILSLNGPRRSWQATVGEVYHRESTPSSYTERDPFRALDTGRGIFRDIRYIRSRILGVYLTDETLDTLMMGTRTDRESNQLVQDMFRILRTSGFIVDKASLDVLELSWTGKERSVVDELPPDRRFIVAASIAAYLTSDWEQSREIFFVAVDETTAQQLFERANVDETRSAALLAKPFVEQKPFLEFFSGFQRHSALHNMLACATLSYVRVVSAKSGKLLVSKRPPGGYRASGEPWTYEGCVGEFAHKLCESHTIGRSKPSSALFRRSNRLDQVPVVHPCALDGLEILTVPLWPLDDLDFPEYLDSKVLFAAATRTEGSTCCAVILDPTQRPLREYLDMNQGGDTSSHLECNMVCASNGWVRQRNRELTIETHGMDKILASFAAQLGDLPVDVQGGPTTCAKAKGRETKVADVRHPSKLVGEASIRGTPTRPVEVEDDEAPATITESATAAIRGVRENLDGRVSSKVTNNRSNSKKSLPNKDRPVRRSKRISSRPSTEHNEKAKSKA
jgi:hypothetical protein